MDYYTQMEKAHLPFKKWLKKKKKPRIMRHEECLREFGIFNLEKINRNMIEILKRNHLYHLLFRDK